MNTKALVVLVLVVASAAGGVALWHRPAAGQLSPDADGVNISMDGAVRAADAIDRGENPGDSIMSVSSVAGWWSDKPDAAAECAAWREGHGQRVLSKAEADEIWKDYEHHVESGAPALYQRNFAKLHPDVARTWIERGSQWDEDAYQEWMRGHSAGGR